MGAEYFQMHTGSSAVKLQYWTTLWFHKYAQPIALLYQFPYCSFIYVHILCVNPVILYRFVYLAMASEGNIPLPSWCTVTVKHSVLEQILRFDFMK